MAELPQPGEPLHPVVTVNCGPLPTAGVALVRFDFISHSMQSVAEETRGRNYALVPDQIRYLIERLQASLRTLESSPPPKAAGPTH